MLLEVVLNSCDTPPSVLYLLISCILLPLAQKNAQEDAIVSQKSFSNFHIGVLNFKMFMIMMMKIIT